MMFRSRFRIRVVSLFTVLMFVASTFGAYAQQGTTVTQIPAGTKVDLSSVMNNVPEIGMLKTNLNTIESALKQIETTATPLYNKIAPSNMEAMTIGERIKAIIGNTKSMVNQGAQSYKGQVDNWYAERGLSADPSFEQQLGVGLNELGVQAGQMPMNGKGDALVSKLKTIVDALKTKLKTIIDAIRARIVALAQKVGLMKKGDKKDPGKEQEGTLQPQADVQYADTFSGKLQKGVAEGTQNAKQSLKSSFSFTNLAVTTTVAVGTNLALQVIKGEKPSFGKAAKAVASVEFAGSVMGSALGAAGGQFTASLVRAFLPGPVGALVGAVVPVMMGSAGGQIGSSLAGDIKNGQFNLGKALRQIDPVDLIGSSVGSTIGMALLSPIPIVGPIIGGIVGGVVGSKVAKWVQGIFKGKKISIFNKGKTFTTEASNTTGEGSGITFGEGQSLGINSGGQLGTGMTPTSNVEVSVSGDIQTVEKKYYETYLKYNKLVENKQYDEAKKVYEELKVYSDQYNALKNKAK